MVAAVGHCGAGCWFTNLLFAPILLGPFVALFRDMKQERHEDDDPPSFDDPWKAKGEIDQIFAELDAVLRRYE